MIKELEKEVGKEAIETNYSESIDSRDKNIPKSVGNYDAPKLDASMSLRYYGVSIRWKA